MVQLTAVRSHDFAAPDAGSVRNIELSAAIPVYAEERVGLDAGEPGEGDWSGWPAKLAKRSGSAPGFRWAKSYDPDHGIPAASVCIG